MLAVEACGDFRLGLTALKSSGVFNRLPDGAAIFAEGSGDSRGSYRSDSRQRLPYSGGSLGGRFLTPTFCRSSLRQTSAAASTTHHSSIDDSSESTLTKVR